MPLGISIDGERLRDICRRYHVARLELFGSRARGLARDDSDVDLLVTFEPDHVPGFAFMDLAEELENLVGRDVDLLVRADAERDRNPFRREGILAATEELYAA